VGGEAGDAIVPDGVPGLLEDRVGASADGVLFVCYEGFLKLSVFDSQVAEPFRRVAVRGPKTLVVFERLDRYLFGLPAIIARAEALSRESGGRVYVVPRLGGDLGLSVSAHVLEALSRLRGIRPLVVHCRGYKGTACVNPRGRIRCGAQLLLDARGLEPEEITYSMRSSSSHARQRRVSSALSLEARVLGEADRYLAVSESLKRHLVAEHGVSAERVTVVSCGVRDDFRFSLALREDIRRTRGWEGRRVGLYAGSLHSWQMSEWVLLMFDAMHETWPEFVGVVSVPPGEAPSSELLDHIAQRQFVELIHASPTEMPGLMAAADVGVLARERNDLNEVAVPVKLLEYLVAGLTVVSTDAVAVVRELAMEEASVVALDATVLVAAKLGDVQALEQLESAVLRTPFLGSVDRLCLSGKMAERYSWVSLARCLERVYEQSAQ
jgi:glycosyltransferase involved in cell wall biosynthesis